MDATNKYPLTMFCELRFIAKSESYLCPSSVFQSTDCNGIACIEVQSTYGTKGYEKFYLELEKAWMDLGGVPHWQKQWDFSPDIVPYIRNRYGANIEKFLATRKALQVDNEDNLFINKKLMEVLYA